jgi:hypothetical protein
MIDRKPNLAELKKSLGAVTGGPATSNATVPEEDDEDEILSPEDAAWDGVLDVDMAEPDVPQAPEPADDDQEDAGDMDELDALEAPAEAADDEEEEDADASDAEGDYEGLQHLGMEEEALPATDADVRPEVYRELVPPADIPLPPTQEEAQQYVEKVLVGAFSFLEDMHSYCTIKLAEEYGLKHQDYKCDQSHYAAFCDTAPCITPLLHLQ